MEVSSSMYGGIIYCRAAFGMKMNFRCLEVPAVCRCPIMEASLSFRSRGIDKICEAIILFGAVMKNYSSNARQHK